MFQALSGQLLIGLINGSFYALLSLGLAIIFGLLNVVNFAHGALYMMGAFAAWMVLDLPRASGTGGRSSSRRPRSGSSASSIERLLLRRLYGLDNLYGLLLTFGLDAHRRGALPPRLRELRLAPTRSPRRCSGGVNLGFMFLPLYRAWVVVVSVFVCTVSWFVIERTKLGAYLRAGTENPKLLQAFGVNVPLMFTITYGFGVALAAFAGVMAAPVYQVTPLMGSSDHHRRLRGGGDRRDGLHRRLHRDRARARARRGARRKYLYPEASARRRSSW